MFSDFSMYIKWAYLGGISGINLGGAIGGVLSNILYIINGLLVSKIILVSLTFFYTLYFLNLGVRQFVAYVYNIFAVIIEFLINAFVKVFGLDEQSRIKYKQSKIEKKKKD